MASWGVGRIDVAVVASTATAAAAIAHGAYWYGQAHSWEQIHPGEDTVQSLQLNVAATAVIAGFAFLPDALVRLGRREFVPLPTWAKAALLVGVASGAVGSSLGHVQGRAAAHAMAAPGAPVAAPRGR